MAKKNDAQIYLRLRDDLAEQIRSEKIGPGERLLSERDMATKLGAARETIREALRMLEGEGLIFRKRGSGYFVSPARWRYDPTHHVKQSRLISDFGFKPGYQDMEWHKVPASTSLARMMNCPENTPLFLVNSVGLQDERKVCYEASYVLASAFPDLLDIEFQSPLTDFLSKNFGVEVEQVGFRARPTNLYGVIAESLGVRIGTLGLFITRIKAKDGVPVWVDREYWLADVLEIVVGDFPQKI